jgi:hypothetical protein
MLLLNALQATRRDTTGLSFGCGAWRHTRSSTRLSATRQFAKRHQQTKGGLRGHVCVYYTRKWNL